MHTISISVSTYALVAASIVSSVSAQEYRFIELVDPTTGAELENVSDINNFGVVIGQLDTPNGDFPATWTATGGIQMLAGFTQEAAPNAINDAGQVAGGFINNFATDEGFLWDAGVITRLGFAPGDSRSTGVDITESGTVLVESGNSGTQGDIAGFSDSFFFDGQNFLPGFNPPGGSQNINELLQVAGAGAFPFVFDGTAVQLLERTEGPGGTASSGRAEAINNRGLIVGRTAGTSGFSAANRQAVFWDGIGSAGTLITAPGESEAQDVNEFDVIVGGSSLGGSFTNGAFRTRPGRPVQLFGDLAVVPANIFLVGTDSVNDLGQVVGRFQRSDFSFGAYLLDPIELGDRFASSVVNSTGSAARIRAIGSASVASDSMLTLQSTAVPEGVGDFALGFEQAPVQLGDAVLALSNPIVIPTAVDQASNIVNLNLDLPAGVEGLSVSFQYFFVDVPAGNTLSSSDGITVTLQN